MMQIPKTPKHIVSAGPQVDFGLGSTGTQVARYVHARRGQALARLVQPSDPVAFQREIEKLYGEFYADSEAPTEQIFEGSFASEPDLILPVPKQYVLLTAHSGRTLMELANTPPFQHLLRWAVPLIEIIDKGAQSEAEGVRLYGAANVLANIQVVWQQLSRAVKQTVNVRNSPVWLQLTARGMAINPHLRIFNVYFSSAGGQASGAVVILLALLYLLIQEDRQNCYVRLHYLAPGFYPARSEAEILDQAMKTQSVIRDLHRLTQKQATLHVPFPQSDKSLEDTTQLFDEMFVHEPVPGEPKERYKTFIRRVSDVVIAMETASFAQSLRSMRSNSSAATRTAHQVRRMLAFEGSSDEKASEEDNDEK